MKHLLVSQLVKMLAMAGEKNLARFARASLDDQRVALCFHRVAERRRVSELEPTLTLSPSECDRLIAFLRDAGSRLTVCFDDGYQDAAEYLLSRAPLFPEVEWLFFVCPEKTERQAGFRWDLAEALCRDDPELDPSALILAPVDLPSENQRPELRSVAQDPDFRLADVELCRRIQRLPNAALGNHTNVHRRQTLMSPEQCRTEYRTSTRDFERLFGAAAHFAFPYGDFSAQDVDALRELGSFALWSTEPRPYQAWERREGAVLPRFAVDGTRSWKETAVYVALKTMSVRFGRRFALAESACPAA
jgi:peptidoglycan/xylan/chitin deacetylase (PgdA/CDA1 family)